MRYLLTLSLVFGTSALGTQLSACGGGGGTAAESYATFQECFTDHTQAESLPPPEAITICCLEHPIGDQAAGLVCGADAAMCSTYVTANVAATDATAAEITTGCTDYQAQK